MKKSLLTISICLCLISVAHSKDSKEFAFMNDIIQACNYCRWTFEYEPGDNDTPSESMAKAMTRNSKFEMAQIVLSKYKKDKDEMIQSVSGLITTGIDLLILANKQRIDIIRGITNHDEKAIQDLDYKVAQINTTNKQGWESIAYGLGFTLPVYVIFSEKENPSGPIPFKISKIERKRLLEQVDKFFGDDLKRYHVYREALAKGQKGNPNDQTWLIVSLDRMRQNLACDTYEDAKKIK